MQGSIVHGEGLLEAVFQGNQRGGVFVKPWWVISKWKKDPYHQRFVLLRAPDMWEETGGQIEREVRVFE
jgi:hypothetical protein